VKKCPYCAELIQDEAILCRYCGSDIPARQGHVEQAPGASSRIEAEYEKLLSSLRGSSEKDLHRYPLSPERRSHVIADIVARIEKNSPQPNVLSHYIWWHSGVSAKKGATYVWQEEAERLLALPSPHPSFPTEDEWISAVAMILVRAQIGGYSPKLFRHDWVESWQGILKAKRTDRIIRGFFFLGAMANVASALSPKKLPRRGSFEWHACRRAYAQVEAIAVHQLTNIPS